MENKVAYVKTCGDGWGWDYDLLNLTGKCKTVTGYHGEKKYYQHRVKLFGIPLWTRWINADLVVWGPAPSVKYFDCECNTKNTTSGTYSNPAPESYFDNIRASRNNMSNAGDKDYED